MGLKVDVRTSTVIRSNRCVVLDHGVDGEAKVGIGGNLVQVDRTLNARQNTAVTTSSTIKRNQLVNNAVNHRGQHAETLSRVDFVKVSLSDECLAEGNRVFCFLPSIFLFKRDCHFFLPSSLVGFGPERLVGVLLDAIFRVIAKRANSSLEVKDALLHLGEVSLRSLFVRHLCGESVNFVFDSFLN